MGSGQVGSFGEWDMWCAAEQDSLGSRWLCPSSMVCNTQFGNPNTALTSFDNFWAAFLIMFQVGRTYRMLPQPLKSNPNPTFNWQVQTMSTWYTYTYMTQRAVGVYTASYFTLLILIVGAIVAELFCAVISFGFEKLEAV